MNQFAREHGALHPASRNLREHNERIDYRIEQEAKERLEGIDPAVAEVVLGQSLDDIEARIVKTTDDDQREELAIQRAILLRMKAILHDHPIIDRDAPITLAHAEDLLGEDPVYVPKTPRQRLGLPPAEETMVVEPVITNTTETAIRPMRGGDEASV